MIIYLSISFIILILAYYLYDSFRTVRQLKKQLDKSDSYKLLLTEYINARITSILLVLILMALLISVTLCNIFI
jgi:hypothetical protein